MTFQESGEIVKLWQNPTRFTQIEKSIYVVFGDFRKRSKEHGKFTYLYVSDDIKGSLYNLYSFYFESIFPFINITYSQKPKSINVLISNIQPQTYVQ